MRLAGAHWTVSRQPCEWRMARESLSSKTSLHISPLVNLVHFVARNLFLNSHVHLPEDLQLRFPSSLSDLARMSAKIEDLARISPSSSSFMFT